MISIQQARNLHLAAQGLLAPPPQKPTRKHLLAAIDRMALLQIDTIHVVARSPYLVLHARLGHYPTRWLDEALARGAIFETWAHEACFAPRADVALHRSYNQATRRHWGLAHAQRTSATQRRELDALLAHIRAHGPVKSSDFERTDGGGGAWWGWKAEKRWLETLFAQGELMVARRENFHRVYDLAERVAPQLCQAQEPLDGAKVHQRFIERAIAALGVTQARWVHDYFRQKPRLKDVDLDALVASGSVQRVAVEGWDAPGYVHADHAPLLRRAQRAALLATHTALLSPFDPVAWDRERARGLFDFDYRLECYTPESKRVHGYFVLPILCCGELIGRLDAKAHRAEGVFEIRSLHTQPGRTWSDGQIHQVALAIARCAAWHGTPLVRVTATSPSRLKAALQRECQSQTEG